VKAQNEKDESQADVLLVDDDLSAISALVRAFKRKGAAYSFHTAQNSSEALTIAQQHLPEVAIVDLSLDPAIGPESGFALIEDLQELVPTVRIIVLTGHGADEVGIKALQRGAASFLQKPADAAHLLALVSDAVSYATLKQQYLRLSASSDNLLQLTGLSTKSKIMHEAIEAVAFAATNNQPVLLTGETGTGKGVLAHAIHHASARRVGPFIRFQPSFTGHDLVASELFGHRKGAFTGASDDRKGLIEEANSGTLFIDEVADLPQETQVLLLDVLQEKVLRRIGSNKQIQSDFRLLTATNKSVEETIEKSLLRHDFYHRIAHFTIEVPPLRDRLEDIPDLAAEFVGVLANRENLHVQGLTNEALQKLRKYQWPGNVRELQAVVEGGAYRASYQKRRFVEASDLRIAHKPSAADSSLQTFRQKVEQYECKLVLEALEKHENNQTQAAQSLGLDRTSMRRILKRAKEDS
jgi:DNA-binding NtrC family response regulator